MTQAKPLIIAHASDVHVDNNYTARLFCGDGAGGLRAVLAAAKAAGADIVLLAGDTFDSHKAPESLIVSATATMREFGLPIVLLPGNHDPAVDEAIYHHSAFRDVDGLHVLGVTHETAVLFPEHDLEIWGDPHQDYFDMAPLAKARERTTRWQIAMAHGHYLPSCDRTAPALPSWLIGDEEIEATQADYVALGHWNRRMQVGNGTVTAWYSGSPDHARSINVVRFCDNASVAVEHQPLELPEGFGGGLI